MSEGFLPHRSWEATSGQTANSQDNSQQPPEPPVSQSLVTPIPGLAVVGPPPEQSSSTSTRKKPYSTVPPPQTAAFKAQSKNLAANHVSVTHNANK